MYLKIFIILFIILFGILPTTIFANEHATTNAITLTIDEKPKGYITYNDISKFTRIIPFLIHEPNYASEIEKTTMCNDPTEPCLLTSTIRQSFTTKNKMSTVIDTPKIKTFLEDIARKVNTDPSNAKLKFNEDTNTLTEITSHTDGISINITDSTKQIIDALQSETSLNPHTIELVYKNTPAQITKENAKTLGIVGLIGEGVSNFAGSTKSRIHNITTAAKRFDGLIIAPNEEFSFVSVLGPVDEEHGYKEELVIRDNETKPEYGGGICQVSTTVFRGAIFTGMKITQRRNHSYPVHYYSPTGFDATVYIPAPDFRFINNTPGHILLNMEIDGTKLIFKYYGTNDNRNVEMKGPFVTDRQPNGAMKTYFTQTVTDKNGKVIIDDVFKSNYKSPNDYPHPGDVAKLTKKPDNWSKNQWQDYKKQNGL
jgi:vancomycin resistance protein YoaR